MKKLDLSGKKYGKLLVREQVGKIGNSRAYRCICDCGNERILSCNQLTRKTNSPRSCTACRGKLIAKPEGVAAFNWVYCTYRAAARTRGLIFDLSKEQFRDITSSKCVYCGVEPSNITTNKRGKNKSAFNGNYIYNGVDRVDNNIGYIISNCVACCKFCNRMKSVMTVEDFKDQISRIYNHSIVTQ